jgi:transglutaminase-like putative cysteine protease
MNDLKTPRTGMNHTRDYLSPTSIIDCDHWTIKEKADKLTKRQKETKEKARTLFYFVRDEIKYNPYLPRYLPEHFRASNTLDRKDGFCVQKAVLLVALCRVVGIPARIGLAVIKNHLLPEKMVSMLHGNVLPEHGYAELYLNDRWIRVTPVFDLEMCRKNRIVPVEFDGENDAKFHSHNQDGQLHIEYVMDRGPYEDVPLKEIREWLIPVLKPEAKSLILGDDP